MIDITKIFPEESYISTLVCLLLFGFLVLLTSNLRNAGRGRCLLIWLLCALFVEFAFWGGDYYHYAQSIINMKYSSFNYMESASNQTHTETPYWILAFFCNYNYLYFRFIIWCGALFLFYLICRLLSIKSNCFLYFFIPISLLPTSGSRACLAQALALLGWYIFIIHLNKRITSIIYLIIGVFLVYFATFFHKSSYFLVALLVLSFFSLSKKRLKLLLVFIPVFAILIATVLVPFIADADINEEGLVNYRSAQSYLEKGVISYGIPTWISVILSYLLYGTMALFLYKSIMNGDYTRWTKVMRMTANVAIYAFVFSVPFVFIPETYSMFYRFVGSMMVPTVYLLSQLKQEKYRYSKIIRTVALMGGFYSLALSMLGKILN